MTRVAHRLVVSIAACAAAFVSLAAQAPAPQGQAPVRVAPRASVAAYLVVDLQTGARLAVRREDVIRQAVAPGGIVKIATLIAALESRTVEPGATFVCPRHLVIDGETFTCSHPAGGGALTLAQALAYSCTCTFASIASRLTREDFDAALASLGLPPSEPAVPLPVAGVGVRGVRATPEQLLTAFVRATGVAAPGLGLGGSAAAARLAAASRRVVVDGARGAADYGSAAVLKAHGLTALAKTGSVPMPGGRPTRLAVVLAPAARPTVGVVVVMPAGAGLDAAAVAGDRVREALVRTAVQKVEPIPEMQLRIGRATASGRYQVETVGLEEYVARVLGGQAASPGGVEARKVLAIVARSFAVANRERHRAEGFDLCDRPHCQAMARATPASRHAAESTRGQVLRYGAKVASVYYTASCGGQTDRPGQVWKGTPDAAYLPSRFEDECRAASRWTVEIPTASVVRSLRSAGLKGQSLTNLWVRTRTAAGRAARIAVTGFEPGEIDGEAFRLAVGRTLGPQLLKSTRFNVTRTEAGYRFEGYGAGPGVGLCLAGASRAAAAGGRAESILATYFPGTVIGPVAVADPRVEITVPAGAERDREAAAELVRRWLKEWAGRLFVTPPQAVSLVFHPTVESYLRATGQPWWTDGSTQGTRADLLPPAVLRQRGTFDKTLKHQVAHLLIGDHLRDRPLWVREAAAMWVAGQIPLQKTDAVAPAGLSGGPSCPSDDEMRQLASAEAMRAVYARACACYSEQIAAGRRWDEIK